MRDYEKEKKEKAYGQGVKDAREAGFLEEVFHGFGDVIMSVFPLTSEYKSYEKGYHDQMSAHNK
jgi:hypothetical protein